VDTNSPPSGLPSTQENRRILLIDDNVAIHEDYRKILVGRASNSELDELGAALFDSGPTSDEKLLNFDVASAYQGQDGLSQVAQALEAGNPFAMAFVDMRMPPGWDGVETIKRIWEIDPHLQVVICSAYSDHSWSELVDALPSVGQWLLLRKPFDSAEVSQLALALTKKWELERQSREQVKDLERIVAERTYELREEMQNRLAAQVALRENDARIRAVFDTTQNGIVIFDENGKVECVNRAACQMFGSAESEMTQSNIADLLIGPDGRCLADSDDSSRGASLADAAGTFAECFIKKSADAGLPVNVKVSCFISCSQRMYAALLQDMTSFKRLQSELSQANKLQAVGQLAAGVAHDINEPLQYLADNTAYFEECFETLRQLIDKVEEISDEAAWEGNRHVAISEIKQVAEQLRISQILQELPSALQDSTDGLRRVQDVIQSMRAVTGQDGEAACEIDLPELLRVCIGDAQFSHPSSVEVVTEFQSDLPTVPGLPSRLRDALANIVGNAIYATQVAHVNADKPAVVVKAQVSGDWAEIEIKDKGCGIPEKLHSKIFEPFFTTKAIGEGRGQSLAVAQATIVEGHCGLIDFSSSEGRGTTFRVRLPLLSSGRRLAANRLAQV
jgi:two-component system, NtrC family, sensor kinase